MAKYASEMLKQAKVWLGKKESDGSHKEIIDIYNNHKPLARGYKVKYTDSWCATFISALAIKVGYTDIIPLECSCGNMIKLAQEKGIWVENENRTPNPGDLIMYDWDDTKGSATDDKGWPEHVGIVESVSNDIITVIEGNYSDSVKRREIYVNAKFIRGYITPKYDGLIDPGKVIHTPKLVIDGEWGCDTTRMSQKVLKTTRDGMVSNQPTTCRRYLQKALTTSWEFKETDFNRGSDLIRAIQRLVGVTVDGHCGRKTIMSMQMFLNNKGFGCGNVDGYMGSKTVKAWQSYINSQL